MRIPRVLDASDPRVDPGPRRRRRGTPRHDVRAGRDYPIRNPEDALLVRVNDDEGPLTSIDRSRLRALGHIPWDERPGFDGQSYAEAHGVTFDHDEFRAAQEEEFDLDERRHEITDRLRKQHETARGPMFAPEPMRDAQANLIDRLLRELSGINADTHALASSWYADERAGGRMTKERASEVITRLKRHCGYEEDSWKKRADFVPPAPPAPVRLTEGLYRFEGHLYQVLRFRDGSDKTYAKLVTFVEGKKRPVLVKAPGITRRLRPEHMLSMDEANEITQKTGWCIFGHFLTNPVSIARGMGPKCWERYGH